MKKLIFTMLLLSASLMVGNANARTVSIDLEPGDSISPNFNLDKSVVDGNTFYDYIYFETFETMDVTFNLNAVSSLFSFSSIQVYLTDPGKPNILAGRADSDGGDTFLDLTLFDLKPAIYQAIFKVSPIEGIKGSYKAVVEVSTPVPEASTWMTMITGLGLLGFVSRRKSKSA